MDCFWGKEDGFGVDLNYSTPFDLLKSNRHNFVGLDPGLKSNDISFAEFIVISHLLWSYNNIIQIFNILEKLN